MAVRGRTPVAEADSREATDADLAEVVHVLASELHIASPDEADLIENFLKRG
jgi:hypothetical protein